MIDDDNREYNVVIAERKKESFWINIYNNNMSTNTLTLDKKYLINKEYLFIES